jgi:cytoskeletal protein CcmA (bactofilin family)
MFERERDKGQPDVPGGASAFLGKGSRITGKLTCEGPGHIEGEIEGEIVAKDTLVIGEAAVVKAQVNGTAVVVHGQVTGDIVATRRLEIRAPGRVFGNITTASLVIQEGAVFRGQCSMGDAEGARAAEKKGPAPATKPERPFPAPSPQAQPAV